jgi:branched-chain amino acid transport system ATP-binding protein
MSSNGSILSTVSTTKVFGGLLAVSDVSIDVAPRSIVSIIGPNGAGKTTFFNLITGAFKPDSGTILLGDENIAGLSAPQIVRRGMGRAFQIASIFPSLTVRGGTSISVFVARDLEFTQSDRAR